MEVDDTDEIKIPFKMKDNAANEVTELKAIKYAEHPYCKQFNQ
jgi:hypothetical protein